jgi:hypothetical protein
MARELITQNAKHQRELDVHGRCECRRQDLLSLIDSTEVPGLLREIPGEGRSSQSKTQIMIHSKLSFTSLNFS